MDQETLCTSGKPQNSQVSWKFTTNRYEHNERENQRTGYDAGLTHNFRTPNPAPKTRSMLESRKHNCPVPK